MVRVHIQKLNSDEWETREVQTLDDIARIREELIAEAQSASPASPGPIDPRDKPVPPLPTDIPADFEEDPIDEDEDEPEDDDEEAA